MVLNVIFHNLSGTIFHLLLFVAILLGKMDNQVNDGGGEKDCKRK